MNIMVSCVCLSGISIQNVYICVCHTGVLFHRSHVMNRIGNSLSQVDTMSDLLIQDSSA